MTKLYAVTENNNNAPANFDRSWSTSAGALTTAVGDRHENRSPGHCDRIRYPTRASHSDSVHALATFNSGEPT
ncbi:hypothetical protein [Bradyrhizobium sp. USDA 336]|uniref:hypothetical protein n=1 Tax=Bradyrhizobium sp. USDA 336 TaxID=3156311 RepID=UPI003834A75A